MGSASSDYTELDEPVDMEVEGTLAVGALVAAVQIGAKDNDQTVPSLLFKFANGKGEMTPAVCLVLGNEELDDFEQTVHAAIAQVKELRGATG